jgi:MFS family permease
MQNQINRPFQRKRFQSNFFKKKLGGDEKSLGFVVGAFSVGRLIGGIGLGWLFNNIGTKKALFVALSLSIIGNILFSLAELTNIWVLLFSRALIGFGSGTLSVIRASLAEMSTKEERVKYMAIAGAV